MIIKKGEITRRVSEADLVTALFDEIEQMTGEKIER
jgi:hypothetical protein